MLGSVVALAVLALFIAALLPPRALPASPSSWSPRHPVARGAYHIHSNRSDGTGTLDEIAAAGAAAGLDFLIVTDHGDGTRAPEPPSYRSGVLVIDAVEISTSGGHYVALDMPQASYRLAGTAKSVADDVKRLGGFGIAAHPDSAKGELRWTDWQTDIDGLEWLNADSEWRDELWASVGRGLLTYFFRPAETLATFLGRPRETLARWDQLARSRRLVGLAGTDAHARLGYRQTVDPYEDRVIARVPGYAASFRTFHNQVQLERPLGGPAAEDAAQILDAIRDGRVYSTVDGLAAASAFDFSATSGTAHAEMGGYLDIGGDVAVAARVAAPPGATIVLLRDGAPVSETSEPALSANVGVAPGVYRIEVRLSGGAPDVRVPWLVSNPIYVGLRPAHQAAAEARSRPRQAASSGAPVDVARWRPETSPTSTSTLEPAGPDGESVWRFSIASGSEPAAYAAVQFPMDGGLAGFDRVRMIVSAARPMRLWAQLRAPATGARWGRTFYADTTPREVVVYFDQLEPFEPARGAPMLGDIDSLLIVADTVNHRAGESGELRVRGLERQK